MPNFYGWSLQDQFRPSDKWLIVPGIRLDTFGFAGGDQLVPPYGSGGNAAEVRQFWWNAFNNDNCQNTKTGAVFPNPSPGQLCPKGSIRTYLYNATNQNFAFNIWQPRLAGTYTSDSNNVIRFSAGRYTEAANTAFEQYGNWQDRLGGFHRSDVLTVRPQHAGISRSTTDVAQLRRLVGAPLQGHRPFVQGDALLAADAEPDPGVLPECQGRLRLRPQRRQPAQPRRRVPVTEGRLLAQRPLGTALLRVHELVHQVPAGQPVRRYGAYRREHPDTAV